MSLRESSQSSPQVGPLQQALEMNVSLSVSPSSGPATVVELQSSSTPAESHCSTRPGLRLESPSSQSLPPHSRAGDPSPSQSAGALHPIRPSRHHAGAPHTLLSSSQPWPGSQGGPRSVQPRRSAPASPGWHRQRAQKRSRAPHSSSVAHWVGRRASARSASGILASGAPTVVPVHAPRRRRTTGVTLGTSAR